MTLTHNQICLLQLVRKGEERSEDGWAPVSAPIMKNLMPILPEDLVTIETVGDEGRGRAKLTERGNTIVDYA